MSAAADSSSKRPFDHFEVQVAGRVCLDIGASTGGFTDCLLQHGAARVYAVDVGSGQLDWKLRTDRARHSARAPQCALFRPEDIGEQVDLAVCDVSFISVTLILPAIEPAVTTGGRNGYTHQTAIRGWPGTGGEGRYRARSAIASGSVRAGGIGGSSNEL